MSEYLDGLRSEEKIFFHVIFNDKQFVGAGLALTVFLIPKQTIQWVAGRTQPGPIRPGGCVTETDSADTIMSRAKESPARWRGSSWYFSAGD
jgi:hypothetical protein